MNYADLETVDGDTATCLVCSHFCRLEKENTGMCGVRKNHKSKIISTVYGHIVALAINSVEKTPLYHVQPSCFVYSVVSRGCNMRCPFCNAYELSYDHDNDMDEVIKSPKEVVENAMECGCNAIAYGYSEPTVYIEYVMDIAEVAKKHGLKNLFITNGFMSDTVLKKMDGLIDAVNLDIKSFSDRSYKTVLSGGLDVIKRNLKIIAKSSMWLEITTLIVPALNDDKREIANIAQAIFNVDRDIPWHIRQFYPAYKYYNSYPTPQKTIADAINIGKAQGLNYVYSDAAVNAENTVCPDCGKDLIIRKNGRAIENSMINGHCPDCSKKVPGIW